MGSEMMKCASLARNSCKRNLLSRSNTAFLNSVSRWARWKCTYQLALSWAGVGNNYSQNYIVDGPHSGFLGGGNECRFDYNHLQGLCYETTECGAFYTGRSWISRGNILTANSFQNVFNRHNPVASVAAVYLADQISGHIIIDNEFDNCSVGVSIGGGRRNQVVRNTFSFVNLNVHIDNRGETEQPALCRMGGLFERQLESVDYQQPPWSTQYPELVSIFQEYPCVPVYNDISHNSYCGGTFIDASTAQTDEWLDSVVDNTEICMSRFTVDVDYMKAI